MGEFKKDKNKPKKKPANFYEVNKDFAVDPNTKNIITGSNSLEFGENPFLDEELSDLGGIINDVTPDDGDGITNEDLKGISIIKPGTNNADIRCDKISVTNYEGMLSGLSDNVGGDTDGNDDGSSEVKSTLNNAVDDYTDSIVNYSQYLEGSPTFVTYYQINQAKSTIDTSLGGIVEVTGAESPLVYNKIVNLPIWNLEEMIATYSYDEFTGLDTDIQTTGIVLPNTIKPRPDEFVYVQYGSRGIALKVNNVETTNILAAVYYRITLVDDSINVNTLNAQVGDTLYYDYELGTLTDSATNEAINALSAILNDIEVTYINTFFNRYYNSFIFNNCYDKFLHKFIHDTHLFIHEKTFMKDIHVEPIVPFNISDSTMYDNSIYERIISGRNKDFLTTVHVMPVCDRGNIYNVFNMGRNRIRQIIHCPSGEIPIFNNYTFELNVNDSVLSSSERIIRKYLLFKDMEYISYINDLKNLQVEYYLKDYIQVPLIIYMLKQMISSLKKKVKN